MFNKILFVGCLEEVINFVSKTYVKGFSNTRTNIPYRYNTELSFFIYDVDSNTFNGEVLKLSTFQYSYSSTVYCTIDNDTELTSKYSFYNLNKEGVFEEFLKEIKGTNLVVISRRDKYGFRDTVSRICGEVTVSYLLGNYIAEELEIPVRMLTTNYNRTFSLLNLNHKYEVVRQSKLIDLKSGAEDLEELTNCLPLFSGFMLLGGIKAFAKNFENFKPMMIDLIDNYLDNDLKTNMKSINAALSADFEASTFSCDKYREQYCDSWRLLKIFFKGEELAERTCDLAIKQINDTAEFNVVYTRNNLPELREITDDTDIDIETRNSTIKKILGHELEKFIDGKNSLKALSQFLNISRNSIIISSNDEVIEYLKEQYSVQFSSKIIKIVNKNKNNKNIPHLINNILEPIFGKIIDWSELDEVLKRTLFPDKFETKSKYSELILRDLDPNLSKNYDLYSPISVLMLINLLSPEDLENELSVLAPAMLKWISNKYTSTYNYDWVACQICRSYILNGENKIINESNWKRLLIEIFKLISKDNSEREIKKFICFCIQGNIDFLSLIENEDVVKSNLKFKKVNMERKFN